MNDFFRKAEELKAEATDSGKRPRMLLHSCCGPCSTACIEYLAEAFDLTILFYNPNIAPEEEYRLRAKEQARYVSDFTEGVKCVICDYEPTAFYDAVKGFEQCKEGGDRCARCFDLRLDFSARYAYEHGFDYFCTTLTVSPHKNAVLINAIAEQKAKKYGIAFFPSDFKKKDGYLRSVRLAKAAGLYRQDYCGCAFSLADRK